MLLDFKKILAARFLFTLAVQMQAVVVGWQMYQLTQDPLQLGLIGLSEAIPAIGFALFAGYFVDRSRPVVVYANVLLGSLLSAVIVLLSQANHLGLSREGQVIALYVASAITGTARSFSQPSLFAIVPRIVPRNLLAKASAWSMSTMQVARISGPALGGLLFGWFGVNVASGLVCLCLVLSLGAVLRVSTEILPPPLQEGRSVREELLSGAKFVYHHPILLPALSLDMISVFFGGVTALLPIFASDVLGIGARGLGLLRGAPAVGAAIMGIWLSRADIRARAGTWLFVSVTGFGLSILVFGLSHSFWLSMVALALSGAFDSVSMVIRSTAVQLASPEKMRGRISAVNSIFIGSSNELGEFESGVAARFLGAVPTVVLGAVVCLLTVGAAYTFSPALRTLHLGKLEAERDPMD
jgi:MFS family permease